MLKARGRDARRPQPRMRGSIRQNAEKSAQAFDAFLLHSGEFIEAPAFRADESGR